jgi:hypothetical protein
MVVDDIEQLVGIAGAPVVGGRWFIRPPAGGSSRWVVVARERESRARKSFCLSQIGRGSEEEKEKINFLLCKFVGAGPTEEFMWSLSPNRVNSSVPEWIDRLGLRQRGHRLNTLMRWQTRRTYIKFIGFSYRQIWCLRQIFTSFL